MQNISRFSDYKRVFDIDFNDVIKTVMENEEVKKSIIEYNQDEQLQKGIDSLGQRIETIGAEEQGSSYPYTRYTVKMRSKKGLQVENVDLKDTGEFYKSFNVKVNDSNVEVLADFMKGNQSIMDNFDSKYDFLGLTKENLKGFITWVFSDYLGIELKKRLLK